MQSSALSKYFRVLSVSGSDPTITVRLGENEKPLSASIQVEGGVTGVTASFYDPESHTWIVRHLPSLAPSLTAAQIARFCVTVRVVVLIDKYGKYDLHVGMSALLDGATHEEACELRRRSLLISSKKDGAGGGDVLLSSVENCVTLACEVDVLRKGFTLCGGGFTSDYPVLRAGPALPVTQHNLYDAVLGLGFISAALTDARAGVVLKKSQKKDRAQMKKKEGKREEVEEEEVEYGAWSVTAAPNAGLACFAISLRLRDVSSETFCDASASTAAGGFTENDVVVLAEKGALTTVSSSQPDLHRGRGGTTALYKVEGPITKTQPRGFQPPQQQRFEALQQTEMTTATAAVDTRSLVAALTLRQQVKVRLGMMDGEWSIGLPPPHGSFSVLLPPTADNNRAVCDHFYYRSTSSRKGASHGAR